MEIYIFNYEAPILLTIIYSKSINSILKIDECRSKLLKKNYGCQNESYSMLQQGHFFLVLLIVIN